MPSGDGYQYSSAPAPLKGKGGKPRYREEDTGAPLTLMSDPRVIRGSTYNLAKKLAAVAEKAASEKQQQNKSATATFGGDATTGTKPAAPSSSSRPTYDFNVKSFSTAIDLTPYLIERNDNNPTTKQACNQTDIFLKRPPTPEYVPRKTGVDISTQVDDVRDLFKFDEEVAPIVDVIVQKTLEQALFEVQSEEELLGLFNEAGKYRAEQEKEKAWNAEKEREAVQAVLMHKRDLVEKEALVAAKNMLKLSIAGIQVVRQLFPVMFEDMAKELIDSKVWRRPERDEVTVASVDPCIQEATRRFKALDVARTMADEIIMEAQKLYEKAPLHIPSTMAKQSLLRIVFKSLVSTTSEDVSEGDQIKIPEIGPLRISAIDTINSIDVAVRAEMKERNVVFENFVSVYDYFVAAAGGRTIARDAPVLNFNMPDQLDIII